MKNTITIDGITLTRDQVERAVESLNARPVVKNLTRVRHRANGSAGVVIVGSVQKQYASALSFTTGKYTVVMSSGGGASYLTEAGLLANWDVVEEGARPSQGTSVQDSPASIADKKQAAFKANYGGVATYGTPAGPTAEYR